MSSRARVFSIDGQGFDAGVVPPGPPSTALATATTKLTDPRLTSIAQGLGALDGDDRARASAWILGRLDSNREGDEILSRTADQMKARLIAQHEALKEQVRAARTEKKNVQAKITALTQELQAQKEKTFVAKTQLDQANANYAVLDPYATRKEQEAAQQAVVNAEKAWVTERDAEGPLAERRNFLSLTEWETATKNLNELEAEELRLRCAISGEPYVDKTFGIQIPERI